MESNTSISYTELRDTTPNKTTKYNIAGIVIDSTQPYKTSKTLIVSLKIVDPSISMFSDDMKVEGDPAAKAKEDKMFRSISVFNDNNKDEIQVISFFYGTDNDASTKNQNNLMSIFIGIQALCFLIHEPTSEELKERPGKQFIPYKMKLQNHEFALTLEEKSLIQNLRWWSNNVFAPMFVYPETMFDLCSIVSKQARECDLHCKILEIRQENDMFYEICIADQSRCKLFLKVSKNNIKQWDIQNGDIVRVRSITLKKGTSNYIDLKPTSNFIKFPKHSRIYQEIETQLKDDHAISALMSSSSDDLILEHPITITKTSERDAYTFKYSNYYDESGNSLQSTKIRVKFCILRIDPDDIKEFVQIYCSDCNATTSLKKYGETMMSNYKCSICNDDLQTELIYQVQFLVKDESTEDIDYVHRVLLYTVGGKCSAFFAEINPTNLYSNYKELGNINRLVNLITKFNIYIEAIVDLKFQGKDNPFFADARL